MYKLWKYYNQNRLKVWTIILAIILGLAIIRSLNISFKNKQNTNDKEETTSNVVSYNNESKSMVNGGSVSNSYSEDFGKLIDQFFTYCIEQDWHRAYSMVSDDTKQVFYQTEEIFKSNYCKDKFDGDKQFSFQSWSSSDNLFIYQVKIFDNMITTGKTNDNYVEEYVTIDNNSEECKLNLNSYLGRKIINEKTEDDNLSVQVINVDKYLDYQVYTLSIKNKNNFSILLDTRRKTNTCYAKDKSNNKFEAVLYENKDEDLKFEAYEMKTIKIKFNVANRRNLEIKSINFTDIVDSEKYAEKANIEAEKFEANM